MPQLKPWFRFDRQERIFDFGIGHLGVSLVRFEQPLLAWGLHPSGGQWSLSVGRTRIVVDWDDADDRAELVNEAVPSDDDTR